jgi:hypothetical protein
MLMENIENAAQVNKDTRIILLRIGVFFSEYEFIFHISRVHGKRNLEKCEEVFL